MTDRASLVYAYGVVPRDFDASGAPAGLDGLPARVLPARGFAALISNVPAADYAPDVVERHSGEMEWIRPRAMAHDRLLTWAQEHGGIVPMSMFSLWAGEKALLESLAEREPALLATFRRVSNADEYGLRLHRRDADLRARLHELDPAIGELQRQAEAASPGQKYLLQSKMAEQSKQAIRAAGARLAREVLAALDPLARESVTLPLTPSATAAPEATLVLNAAFLVDRAGLDAFRAQVAKQQRAMEPRGLSFDFTGPWPPYNFVA